jgi:acetoin utilization protein AcuB
VIARELITDNIPPLKPSDSGTRALEWMYEFRTTHLPLVDKGKFIGLITEDDILNFNHPNELLKNYNQQFYRPIVRDTDHLYEVMRVAAEIRSPLIPVVDEDENYQGLITMVGLLQHFAQANGMRDEGGILVVRMKGLKDYLLSDIARLVESNNAYVLSSYLRNVPNSTDIRLTLKVSTTEIQHIVSTLERFEYEVEAWYREDDSQEELKDRYDSLMNYLNI